ncbi:putative reverse transcriptase domain-containing protein [Tanacetum coccineum]|uniref:Reverse transcriptase domain-containing protein n=1 Tax=Tanacetum coccineum TaxID=301880 RepID=A0ABQ5A638_9ASTR
MSTGRKFTGCDKNGNDGNNGNGIGNHEDGGNNGNGNPNENGRGAMPVARMCTYQDFVKCQPLNFKGTEGVVGLTRWFEKMETVFHISNCLEVYEVKNNDLAAYTQRFQELTLLCTRMVPEEEDRIKRYVRGYAIRSVVNKRKFESNKRDNRAQQSPFKRKIFGGLNMARAYTAGGLAGYYRRFTEGFSKIAKPMTKLTQKSMKFNWGEKEEAAFQTLKQKLCSAPILALPEGSENFMVYCDASHKGLGAVLMQKEKGIAYASL